MTKVVSKEKKVYHLLRVVLGIIERCVLARLDVVATGSSRGDGDRSRGVETDV